MQQTTYICDACGEPIKHNHIVCRFDRAEVREGAIDGRQRQYDLHSYCAETVDNFLRHGVRAGRR